MTVSDLPALNATLNATATVLITAGYILIKRGQLAIHRRVMTTAMVVSALFLVSYLTYHGLRRGLHTEFGGHGAIRTVYLRHPLDAHSARGAHRVSRAADVSLRDPR